MDCLRLAWLLPVLMLAGPVIAHGQEIDIEADLDGAKELYRNGRFADAIATLRTVVDELGRRQQEHAAHERLADAHLLLALSYFAVRDEPAAVDHFKHVLGLDPERTLDPEIYSPRVIGIFERARTEAGVVRPSGTDVPEPRLATPAVGTDNLSRTSHQLLPTGTRVRVRLRGADEGVVGHLSEMDERALTIVARDNLRLTFPREVITKLEVMKSRRSHWRSGGLIGIGVGVVAGLTETPGCDSTGTCYTRAENVAIYSIGFGVMGGLIGALVKTDEWVDASGEPLVVAVSPDDHGVRVLLAWRF